jgi:hypothetical protein
MRCANWAFATFAEPYKKGNAAFADALKKSNTQKRSDIDCDTDNPKSLLFIPLSICRTAQTATWTKFETFMDKFETLKF